VNTSLYAWTKPQLHTACHVDYRSYYNDKTERAKAYFAAREHLKDPAHAYKAKDIAAALPPGWEGLADLIPRNLRHLHHLSGNSSQLLALGLLGAARRLDASHNWLWGALRPLPPARSFPVSGRPEVELNANMLGEDPPRVTSIDYLVEDEELVMCIECKWAEEGIGGCSCARDGGDPSIGSCREAVRNHRPLYWSTAADVFHLPGRKDGQPCPLSPVYQAVRNVAAALELRPAGGVAVFGLIYDAANPYFSGCGKWPGWPTVLEKTLDGAHPDLRFRAISWQELMPLLPLDADVRTWASEKYGLGTA
jgi:hypothetical protein